MTRKVRRCRGCGCTDRRGCPWGCWWAAPDLCSSCQLESLLPADPRTIEGEYARARLHARLMGLMFDAAELATWRAAGKRLAERRKAEGLDLAQAAAALGISVLDLVSMERGRMRPIGMLETPATPEP